MPLDIKNRPRFSPIRNLTPERLTQMLDTFEQGYLAEAALTWNTIEKRDDTIKSVVPKRQKAIARYGRLGIVAWVSSHTLSSDVSISSLPKSFSRLYSSLS